MKLFRIVVLTLVVPAALLFGLTGDFSMMILLLGMAISMADPDLDPLGHVGRSEFDEDRWYGLLFRERR